MIISVPTNLLDICNMLDTIFIGIINNLKIYNSVLKLSIHNAVL